MSHGADNSIRIIRQPTAADFAHARDIVARRLAPTPLVPAATAGGPCSLKLESMQPTGSFKVRGALAAMSGVPEGSRVLAVSAGNHALGIAWASHLLGVQATVVIAETASPAKRAKLERLPIELVRHGQSYDEAEAYALELARDAPAATVFISAYNDPLVIAGASTVLDEIVAQSGAGGPLTVVVPTSGGGLLAGVAMRASELSAPDRPIAVIGVELETSPAMSTALAAGHVVEIPVGETIADGMAGNFEPGSITVDLISGRIAGVVAVSEAELRAALRFLASEHGLIAEGSGAATLAAILAGKIGEVEGEIVAIVSGRNIALPLLAEVLAG